MEKQANCTGLHRKLRHPHGSLEFCSIYNFLWQKSSFADGDKICFLRLSQESSVDEKIAHLILLNIGIKFLLYI